MRTVILFSLGRRCWLLLALLFLSLAARGEELCVQFDTQHQVAGVLELPAYATDTVAMILPGIHTQDRNGPLESFVPGEGVYTTMAKLLRAQGLAVVRLDTPMTVEAGASNGCTSALSRDQDPEVLQASYRAVAEYLRQMDHGRRFRNVLFVGHSLGAVLGAQILAQSPHLADGFYMVSMSLRPLTEMAHYQGHNLPLLTLRSLMENGPNSCISNEEIVAARTVLEPVLWPIDRWLSPSGRWCKNTLTELRARLSLLADQGEQLARECDAAGTEDHVGEFGNNCRELQLFFSATSIAQLLRTYPGQVGIAYGKRDGLIALGPEGDAFRSFALALPQRRRIRVLDMGHNFGEHPYLGPAKESAMQAFVSFIAETIPRYVSIDERVTPRAEAHGTIAGRRVQRKEEGRRQY